MTTRLLFVHAGRDWIRGAERCLLDLLATLDRSRFEPALLADAPSVVREARALGARTFPLVDWTDAARARPARGSASAPRR